MDRLEEYTKENNTFSANFLKRFWIIFVIVFFVQGIYFIYSKIYFQIGFPLDDSWIHQTYARNLLFYGDWYFLPEIKSAGSTAPLWTLLLVPGHFLKNNFFIYYTYFISGFIFALCCIVIQLIFDSFQSNATSFPWVGTILALEWHLIWAANSGMETIFFIFLIIFFFFILEKEDKYPSWAHGLVLGLIIFIRPDGITLIGPYLLIKSSQILLRKNNIWPILFNLLIVFCFLGIYFFFNYRLSGEILPNTFFAKQAEYQILFNEPLVKRIFNLSLIPLTGAGILLFPGFVYFLYKKIKDLDILILSIYLWLSGYLMIYALRLPVTYQHGRYLIPIIPLVFLLSFLGYVEISKFEFRYKFHLVLAFKTTFMSILLIFLYLGARAYSQDVAIIQSEMVATAQWIEKNLDKTDIIAAHDIGALGFYTNKKIIDLAGLINPEIIPIIRDEQKIEHFLNEKHADYLVVFPGWYDSLDNNKKIRYSSVGEFSPQFGGENLVVFFWE